MSETVSTPCIRVCAIEAATSLCAGCGRSLREIGGWSRMTEAERKTVMAQLPARLAAAQAKA
ncbi:MAG: DUF1289 domain-containing protein [Alphaproteobacteria bacterium]|nr:DUF1289 domain-containing protein [Alphaproteobacteria bacterium]